MYQVSIECFYGDEVRVSHCPAPSSSKSPLSTAIAADRNPELVRSSSAPTNLVRRLESERGRWEGVSGFGGLPRPTVFGLPARRAVRRLSKALDDLAPKPEDLLFFTGTLPGSTVESLEALSRWSGYVVHRLKSWLNRIAPGYECVFCWEWQRRGALHLHLAVWVPEPRDRELALGGMRGRWIGLLRAVGEKSGVDLFARGGGKGTWKDAPWAVRARCEIVRKSVGAYLGKYLSKSEVPAGGVARKFYPSRWWGSTRGLKILTSEKKRKFTVFVGSYRKAASSAEWIASILEPLAEWARNYKMRVVRGGVWCGLGIPPLLTERVLKMVFPMYTPPRPQGFSGCAERFNDVLRALRRLKPRWFSLLVNDYPDVRRVWERVIDEVPPGVTPEDQLLVYFNAALALEQAVREGRRMGSEWLTPQLVASCMNAAVPLQAEIRKVWDDLYLDITETESFIREELGCSTESEPPEPSLQPPVLRESRRRTVTQLELFSPPPGPPSV